jgi:hypothetical protein
VNEIKSDKIEIIAPRDAYETVGGAKPEPEEVPAQRVLETVSPVDGHVRHEDLGNLRTRIVTEDTAQTFAQSSKCCGLCFNWNNELWRKLYPKWRFGDAMQRRFLNRARAFLPDGPDGTAEQAIVHDLGVCNTLTEINGKTEVVTHASASCPGRARFMENIPDGTPLPNMWTPKDIAHRKLGEAVYDGVMRVAMGKGKR